MRNNTKTQRPSGEQRFVRTARAEWVSQRLRGGRSVSVGAMKRWFEASDLTNSCILKHTRSHTLACYKVIQGCPAKHRTPDNKKHAVFYRLISLTPFVHKLSETINRDKLAGLLDANNLILAYQHWYHSVWSCQTILEFLSRICMQIAMTGCNMM